MHSSAISVPVSSAYFRRQLLFEPNAGNTLVQLKITVIMSAGSMLDRTVKENLTDAQAAIEHKTASVFIYIAV